MRWVYKAMNLGTILDDKMKKTVETIRFGCGVSRVLHGCAGDLASEGSRGFRPSRRRVSGRAGAYQHFLAVGSGPIEPFYALETILNSTLFSGMQECITRYREVEE